MNSIAINFSPLKHQNYEFDAYRKEVMNGERKIDFINAKKVTIIENELTKNYWYSFTNQEGFEKTKCFGQLPIGLTIFWIQEQLIKINKALPDKTIISAKFHFLIEFEIISHIEGSEIIWLEPYFLESRKLFGFLIGFRYKRKIKDGQQTTKDLINSLALDKALKPNKNFHIDQYNKVKEFAKQYYSYFRDSAIDFSGFLKLDSPKLSAKKYIFANGEEATSQFKGIIKHHPYKNLNKEPFFIILYRAGEEKLVNDLIGKLKGETDRTFEGFKSVFQSDFKVFVQKAVNITIQEIAELIEKKGEDNVIAIAFEANNFDKSQIDKYYSLKYHLIKRNIPIQIIQYSTVNKPYTTSNIALQIFSKLGGIPWTVKPQNNNTLIIGLSQVLPKYQTGKYYGYSVLIESSGIYKDLKVLSTSENKSDYLTGLSEALIRVLKDNQHYDKIIIHSPFRERERTVDELINLIHQEVRQLKEVVFLRINTNNRYFGFNLNVKSLVPEEASMIKLAHNKYLVWFEGLIEASSIPSKLYSGPTFVEFAYSNKELNDLEIKGHLQDLINLSGANWRGFNSKNMPVSIYYCQILTKFIAEFNERNLTNLKESTLRPWFL